MSAGYLRKCAGKERHETKKLAEDARRSMVGAGKWRMDNSNTYRCTQCGTFHTGHVRTSKRQTRGKR